MIGVDPLDVARPAQRLQPTDVRADESLWVAADAIDGGARTLQMDRRAIDALIAGDVHDVAVGGPRS